MTSLAPMGVGGRLGRLRELVTASGCDALLVTNVTNLRYLCGFSGSAALLLVSERRTVLVTDGRYGTQAVEELEASGVDAEVEVGDHAGQRRATAAAAAGVRRLGLEAAHVSWARQRAFAEWFPGVELVPTESLVEGLRLVKDGGEVARMAAAAAIADAAFQAVRARLSAGVTEREVALELDAEMRRRGSDGSAFSTIVAAGPNGAKPHAHPSARPIGNGELVVIDMGAVVDGYRSDMTRTVCLGEPAAPALARVAEVVTASQAAGVAAVRAGVDAREVDRSCREVIVAAGWGHAFLHGAGHGVGLDIHEAPWVGSTSAASLDAGVVITVEPGVYLPDVGGARIEDTVVVTDDGCRPLTRSPKDLVIR